MLDRRFIREHEAEVRQGIIDKHEAAELDDFLSADLKRRELLVEVEALRARRNQASQEIGEAKKSGQDASAAIAAMKKVSDEIKEGEGRLVELEEELSRLELSIPNLPDSDVPRGGEEANETIRSWGEPKKPDYAKPHWETGERLGLMDLEAAARMSGSGFILLKGAGARLERALINWFLDVHLEQGYQEINAPYLVRDHSVRGTGQLPKLAEDMYQTMQDGLWLIPTAEVSVTNIHRESILAPEDLPRRYVSFSPCFRREAGSAGKDTRGMLRVHQFHKVEMVRFCRPEDSERELEELVTNATDLLEALELPYRVVKLATGDLSFAAAKCYDLEVYSPGVDAWLEVSSCSNFRDFQARRAQIRWRREKGEKPVFVHTLNGSGLALPRVLVAIMENHLTGTGKIRVPEVLRPYMGGLEYIG